MVQVLIKNIENEAGIENEKNVFKITDVANVKVKGYIKQIIEVHFDFTVRKVDFHFVFVREKNNFLKVGAKICFENTKLI